MQGPLHANFKLSADGEELALFASDGATNLDWIEFGPQLADILAGRLPGFPAVDLRFPVSTPRQWNQAEPGGHLAYYGANPFTVPLRLWANGTPSPGLSVEYSVQ